MPSGASIAHGCEPRPPAFDTAIARALPCDPAIGAWMIGRSIPNRSVIMPERWIISRKHYEQRPTRTTGGKGIGAAVRRDHSDTHACRASAHPGGPDPDGDLVHAGAGAGGISLRF